MGAAQENGSVMQTPQSMRDRRRRTLWAWGLMSALPVCVMAGIGGNAVQFAPVSMNPVPRTYFGMHIHRADTTTRWPIAQFAVWRFWDAAVSWERLEPEKGKWDFKRLDNLVALAESRGVEPLLTLGITPRWAASKPDQPFVYGNGGNSPPRDMRDWGNYVRTVAMRYKGRIAHYELWNEPTFDEIDNGKGFYAGSAKAMVELGRVAYRVIKEVDPNNKLLSPGFTDEGARLDLYLGLGGRNITDIVAHHFYAEKPEHLPGRVARVRSVMAKHGLTALPLWNTESGYNIPESGRLPVTHNGPRNDTELAGYIARILVMGIASGLDRFYWYSWESTMLSHYPKDVQSSPAIVAYMQTMRWMDGVVLERCHTEDHNLWVCELHMGTHEARMVWHASELKQWTPPADWLAVQYETLNARVVDIKPGVSIPVGVAPILVKSSKELWSSYLVRH